MQKSRLLFSSTVLTVVTFLKLCDGYSSGAPTGTCSSMTPGHGFNAKTSTAPYDIILPKTVLQAGETFAPIIRVKSNSNLIVKGFFAQAKKVGGNQENSHGQFESAAKIKTLNCFNKPSSAASHSTKINEREVQLQWTAPVDEDQDFQYQFRLTIVHNFVTWWEDVESESFLVKRSLQPETTTNSPITDAPVTDPPTSNSPTVNSPINTQPTDHQQKTDSPQTTATNSYSNTQIPTAGSASPTLKNFSVIIPVLFTLTFDFLLG